jgi:phosphoglycerate kinase
LALARPLSNDPVIAGIRSIDDGEFSGKRVLLRVDINSPIDHDSGRIVNDNRIIKSAPTIRDLSAMGAKLAIIAHQGDTTDYASLVGLRAHAERLSSVLEKPVEFIEDIAGPAAIERVEALKDGEVLLLDNLRYLTEEVSTFEDSVKLSPGDMANCYLVRRLAPVFDCYVNDAFAAAHRNAPSMVAFQELLPSYAGRLLMQELEALTAITDNPRRPCTYLLGGSRAGDAFGMIQQVLRDGSADRLLLSGLVGQIFMMADGVAIGETSARVIRDKGLEQYIDQAANYLEEYRGKISYPVDVAVDSGGNRRNVDIASLDDSMMISDIGDRTIKEYCKVIAVSKTLFVNGPAGIYESKLFEKGTQSLWTAIADTDGFSVVGGGDSVTSFSRYVDMSKLDYVSTAGGALIRYLSGVRLPLIEAISRPES